MFKTVKNCWDRGVSVVKKVASSVSAVIAGGTVATVATNAHAATGVDLTGISFDTATIFAFAALVVAAIVAIWPIRKLVKLGNRS